MDINDYKYLGIYLKDAISTSGIASNSTINPSYKTNMSAQNDDIFDDHIVNSNICIL